MEKKDPIEASTAAASDELAPATTLDTAKVESLKHEDALENLEQSAGHDAVFQAQAGMINQAIQDIGMGKYQWALFCTAGYGWLCDQVCGFPPSRVPSNSSKKPPPGIRICCEIAKDKFE